MRRRYDGRRRRGLAVSQTQKAREHGHTDRNPARRLGREAISAAGESFEVLALNRDHALAINGIVGGSERSGRRRRQFSRRRCLRGSECDDANSDFPSRRLAQKGQEEAETAAASVLVDREEVKAGELPAKLAPFVGELLEIRPDLITATPELRDHIGRDLDHLVVVHAFLHLLSWALNCLEWLSINSEGLGTEEGRAIRPIPH